MKSIGIDFSNRMLCIMTEGQQGKGQAKKTGHRYIMSTFSDAINGRSFWAAFKVPSGVKVRSAI